VHEIIGADGRGGGIQASVPSGFLEKTIIKREKICQTLIPKIKIILKCGVAYVSA
jgi:hypothetical protein